jgi:hypothetical protein
LLIALFVNAPYANDALRWALIAFNALATSLKEMAEALLSSARRMKSLIEITP